ncbi:MAG TPA: CBS domain-containing protein [Kofleriaceae bacterium]|jgi:CBS domain-containing protein|nr:CBS domain-containing protein [Kofleriaceae bacterium]
MAQLVREVMTKNPVTLSSTASILDAAKKMKEGDIGGVIVTKNNQMCGIVTDRDIVVRAVAEEKNPQQITLEEVCSQDVTSVSPDDDVSKAVQLMRDKAVRRLPVTDKGKPVGIVSLGDLAQNLDRKSALGEISAKPPNK